MLTLMLHVSFEGTMLTVDKNAVQRLEFSRQKIRVSNHALLQGNVPDPGMEPGPPALQARFFTS